VSVVWRQPKENSLDCYLRLTEKFGLLSSPNLWCYLNLPSAMGLVPHSKNLRVLKPLDNVTLDEDDSDVDNFQPDQRGE
jgi:hypothetical protein